jgi:hypothetical protein
MTAAAFPADTVPTRPAWRSLLWTVPVTVFRNFSSDFVTASRTLKRRVGEKAASRKFWVAGAPDQSIEHSFDGMSRVRIW